MKKHTMKRKTKSARPEAVEPFLDEELTEEHAHVRADSEEPAAGDALGVYLQQMASIPMLNRRQELELENTDVGASDEAPVRITALLGLFFSLGVMLILVGIFGGMYDWVAAGWQYRALGRRAG